MNASIHRFAQIAAVVTFVVIVLGAFVRLSDAGLGCPDWPGCYGQLTWPAESHEVVVANEAFPERPVESDKAWKEMVHRYLAGFLMLMVVGINVLAWAKRSSGRLKALAGALLLLILFQALLGMWTVTLKLLPIVVMGHLLGGLATFSLLIWIAMSTRSPAPPPVARSARPLIVTGLLMLVLQLALGGWTSANYSALVCPDFPTCQGSYWPNMNFKDGFVLWREIGVDYEGGVLDLASRTAIHVAHRLGAVVTFILLGLLSLRMLRDKEARQAGAVLGVLLLGQVMLGILNVVLLLPLPNAVAHNGGGALLLACMLWLLHRSREPAA